MRSLYSRTHNGGNEPTLSPSQRSSCVLTAKSLVFLGFVCVFTLQIFVLVAQYSSIAIQRQQQPRTASDVDLTKEMRATMERLRTEIRLLKTGLGGKNGTNALSSSNSAIEIQNLVHSLNEVKKIALESKKEIERLGHDINTILNRDMLIFLHIGKTGGTSFDAVGGSIARKKEYEYIGKKHFDWGTIEEKKRDNPDRTAHVVTILREPVDRALSHLRFMQTLPWTKGMKMRSQNVSEFLFDGDKQKMLDARDVWQDGQAGVSWLTGTHVAGWAGAPEAEVEERERRGANATAMLHLAAERLRETKWFGILDHMERSMELLQHAFNLTSLPKMAIKNRNKFKSKHLPSRREVEAMASLMPQDIWFYNYSLQLFEARWQEYKTGTFVAPEEPPIPETLSCVSTRFDLWCNSGPLAKLFPPTPAVAS